MIQRSCSPTQSRAIVHYNFRATILLRNVDVASPFVCTVTAQQITRALVWNLELKQ